MWQWFGTEIDSDYASSYAGALNRWMSAKGRIDKKLPHDAQADLYERIDHSRVLLSLP